MVHFNKALHFARFLVNTLTAFLSSPFDYKCFKHEVTRHYIFFQKELILEEARALRRESFKGLREIK